MEIEWDFTGCGPIFFLFLLPWLTIRIADFIQKQLKGDNEQQRK